jgi:hypothetical protein
MALRMVDSNNSLEVRRRVGIGLRTVPVLILAGLWYVYLWWWIALGCVMIGLIMTILHPIAFVFLYPITYLGLAFTNSADPVLPDYWDQYPEKYFEYCPSAAKLGYRTLLRWLLTGF